MISVQNLYKKVEDISKKLDLERENGNSYRVSKLESKLESFKNIISSLEAAGIESVNKIIVKNIEWDIDDPDTDEIPDLPEHITIDIDITNAKLLEDINNDAESLSDYISDIYGYCHEGFIAELR